MAFVKVSKSKVGSSTNNKVPLIRMGSHLQSAKLSSRGLYFAINRKAIELAGWTPVQVQARDGSGGRLVVNVTINEGTYEDAGFLMLNEDPKGYALGTNKFFDVAAGYALTMNVSVSRIQHYVLNDVSNEIEPEEVEFTIDAVEHSILIQCPDWLRYNPLSLPEKEDTPPPVKIPAIEPQPPRLNREERRRLAKITASRLR